jgi:ATP-dependent protease ClpP protease subunit
MFSWMRAGEGRPAEAPPAAPAAARWLRVSFSGPIDSVGAGRLCSACNSAVNDGFAGLDVAFNSPGGYVADGVFLFNYVRALPIPVRFHNLGTVASIAAVVFCAGSGNTCAPNSLFLIHPVVTSPTGSISTEPWRGMLEYSLADEERIDNILAERTRIPADLLARRRTHDVMIAPEKALEFGLVEAVAPFALAPGEQLFNI